MGFGTAISTCFKKYFVFSGRARRPEYWYFFLLTFLVGFIPGVGPLFGLVALIPSLAVAWRRMHDIGKPGYYSLLPTAMIVVVVLASFAVNSSSGGAELLFYVAIIAVLIASVVTIVWLASPTQPGPNQYGPEPGREIDVEGVFD